MIYPRNLKSWPMELRENPSGCDDANDLVLSQHKIVCVIAIPGFWRAPLANFSSFLGIILLPLFACMAMMIPLNLEASQCARCRLAAGWGLASKPSAAVDPAAMMTISGEVVSVEEIDPDKDIVPGVYVLVACEGEQYPVRVCAKEVLSKENVHLEPFDKIKVTGSKVDMDGKVGLIATELQHSNGTLHLSTLPK